MNLENSHHPRKQVHGESVSELLVSTEESESSEHLAGFVDDVGSLNSRGGPATRNKEGRGREEEVQRLEMGNKWKEG